MLKPPLPVKSNEFEAVLSDAMPQFGEFTVTLPWMLIEPVRAKTHGFAIGNTRAVATAPMVTDPDMPGSTRIKYVGCCWLTIARTKLPPGFDVHVGGFVLVSSVPISMLTDCDVPGNGTGHPASPALQNPLFAANCLPR